jgi:hypothetical protein
VKGCEVNGEVGGLCYEGFLLWEELLMDLVEGFLNLFFGVKVSRLK